MSATNERVDLERVRERVRLRVRVPAHRRRSRWRRALPWILVVVGVLVVALALDGLWAGTTIRRELARARDELARGGDELEAGRTHDAQASFELARVAAERASEAGSHPAVVALGVVPGLRDDASAVRELASAAELVARAGSTATGVARAVGWDGERVPGLESAAAVDVAVFRRAAPGLDRAAGLMRQAAGELDAIDASTLVGPVREAVVSARREVSARAATVQHAAQAAALLPGLLGHPQPRAYLVLMQNLSDPRGAGGHPGSYALLRARDGRISLAEVGVLSALPNVPRVRVEGVAARYAKFGSFYRLVASTYPPDFPTAARLMLALWGETGRPSVDGVIAVDSVWMSYVLDALGPLRTPAWPTPITARNVSRILDADTFRLPQPASDRIQTALATAIWRALLARPLSGRAFAEALGRAARERHLQVYSADGREESLLEGLGAAGSVRPEPNALMVVWDGGSDSRSGYFAQKRVGYRADVHADGSADVSIDVELRNTAPTGPPSILLGTGTGEPVGTYSAWVNVYAPVAAEALRSDGGALELVERELGRKVLMGFLTAPPQGGTDVLHVRYHLPSAVREVDGRSVFRIQVVPQPALRPDAFDVQIRLPGGSSVVGTSAGVHVSDSTASWTGTPVEPTDVSVTFAR